MATACPPEPASPRQDIGIILSPPNRDTLLNDSGLPAVHQLSIHDLRSMTTDIKEALNAAISDLKIDLQVMNGRIQKVEENDLFHRKTIKQINYRINFHNRQLRDMQRHVEEIDNRGRRHNLRIRGLPEYVDNVSLPQVVSDAFNDILNIPERPAISMERIHRALRPKGKDSDPPRDVICFVNDFKIKESILKKAREMNRILFEGHQLQIFQDLSAITLKNRRDLRPLLEVLNSKNIRYKWKFPFGLFAYYQNRSALLRVPEELPAFCKQLDLPLVAVPDWYAEFATPTVNGHSPPEEPMEALNSRTRRRRSPSPSSPVSEAQLLNTPFPHSPPAEPLPRRSRRDQAPITR